jgi:hypothetical protein
MRHSREQNGAVFRPFFVRPQLFAALQQGGDAARRGGNYLILLSYWRGLPWADGSRQRRAIAVL